MDPTWQASEKVKLEAPAEVARRNAELEERFGEPLMGYQLLLDAEMPDGYVRQWQLRMLSPERHVGYAIQWFSLAGTLLVIAVILGLRARKFSAEG